MLFQALEKEMRKKAKMSQSPAGSPLPAQNSPAPARNSPLTHSARSSPLPKDTPPVTSPRMTKNSSPVKPPSLTDCLPPQITAAILPAIKVTILSLQARGGGESKLLKTHTQRAPYVGSH